MKIRVLLAIGLEAIYVTYWQRTLLAFGSCPDFLCEAEFKCDEIIDLVGEISRQQSIKDSA
jgi:hypothetical protein